MLNKDEIVYCITYIIKNDNAMDRLRCSQIAEYIFTFLDRNIWTGCKNKNFTTMYSKDYIYLYNYLVDLFTAYFIIDFKELHYNLLNLIKYSYTTSFSENLSEYMLYDLIKMIYTSNLTDLQNECMMKTYNKYKDVLDKYKKPTISSNYTV